MKKLLISPLYPATSTAHHRELYDGEGFREKRLEPESGTGMSFTEFSYNCSGYGFEYLYEHEGCKLRLGGSDQWGNYHHGIELIRRRGAG